jgi:hypothetical protein
MATVITKTIGTGPGRDYPGPKEWLGAAPASLVDADVIWKGVFYNDSEFVMNGYVGVGIGGTDADHYVEMVCAPGHSYRDHANRRTNALRYNPANGVAFNGGDMWGGDSTINIWSPFTRISGIQVKRRSEGCAIDAKVDNCIFDGVLIEAPDKGINFRNPTTVTNCVVIVTNADARGLSTSYWYGSKVLHTTVVKLSTTAAGGIAFYSDEPSLTVENCAFFGFAQFSNFTKLSNGSGPWLNNASDLTIPFGTDNVVLPYASQFVSTTAANMDFKTLQTSGLVDKGKLTTTSPLTAIDVFKTKRQGLIDIGAHEWIGAAKIPDAPTNLVARPGHTFAMVSFTLPFDNGADIIQYDYETSTGQTDRGYTSPIRCLGVNGTPMQVRIRAVNSVGPGPYSEWSNTVTPTYDVSGPALVTASTDDRGEKIVLTFDETIYSTSIAKSAFTIDAGRTFTQVVIDDKTVTLMGITPAYLAGQVGTVSYTKPATDPLKDFSTNQTASFGPINVTNIVPTKVDLPGYILKTVGNRIIDDFSTAAQLATYLSGMDVVAGGLPVMIWLYKNINLGTSDFNIATSNDSLFVTIRPGPGLSFNELEPLDSAKNYGTVGIEITAGDVKCPPGVVIEDCRITGKLQFNRNNWNQVGPSGMRRCRHKATAPTTMIVTGYTFAEPVHEDTLFILDTGDVVYTGGMFHAEHIVALQRCTVVRLNGAKGGVISNNANNATYANNCVFVGVAERPWPGSIPNNALQFCYTDTVLSAETQAYHPGMKYATVATMFKSSTDYRLSSTSPLIGKADTSKGQKSDARSTLDNMKKNRGLSPDIGAFQLVSTIDLATAEVTYLDIDGQTVMLMGKFDKNPTSAILELEPTPGVTNNTATYYGTYPIKLDADKTFTIEVDGLNPGSYRPKLTFTNAGGDSLATRITPFEILSLKGGAKLTIIEAKATITLKV